MKSSEGGLMMEIDIDCWTVDSTVFQSHLSQFISIIISTVTSGFQHQNIALHCSQIDLQFNIGYWLKSVSFSLTDRQRVL